MSDNNGATEESLVYSSTGSAHQRAVDCLLRLRDSFGGWEGEVVWCPIITAQAVIAFHVMGRTADAAWARLVLRQFAVTQHESGGWGLHSASLPYRFMTTLVYVAARLLGEPASSPLLQRARSWLDTAAGDVYGLPSWGKFWLFVLGLYDTRRLLASSLYEAFSRNTPELRVIRRGLECYWRDDARGRAASISLLAMMDVRIGSVLREMMSVILQGMSLHRQDGISMLDQIRLTFGLSQLVARQMQEVMRVR